MNKVLFEISIFSTLQTAILNHTTKTNNNNRQESVREEQE